VSPEAAQVGWPEAAAEPLPLPGDIITLAREALERDPDRPLLVFEDGLTLTRRDVQERVEALAGYLTTRIGPGDRVAIMLDNRAEWLVAWLAVNACNAGLVSINTSAGPHDAGHIVRDSAAVLAIVGGEAAAVLAGVQDTALRETIVVAGPEPDGFAAVTDGVAPLALADVVVDPDAITNVYYTSGTTGPPKGCMVGHDYWVRFVDLYLRLFGLGPDDRILCCLQFFYNDPPWEFLVSLHAGSALVVMRRFSVSRFWPTVVANGVNRLFALASIPALLLRGRPVPEEREHRVTMATNVGIPAPLHEAFVERWGMPWLEAYGLTESGLVVAMPLEYADEMTGSGAMGIPCPGVTVRLAGDDGEEVPTGEPGEVWLRAPGLMRGYLNQPEETERTMAGGWLHTGDLARRDERGFLYFLGRKKDIIRRAGENVAAAEVENVLRSHPDVLDAAVVPVQDDLRGEEVKAYVALNEGVTQDSVSPPVLAAFCRERLAKHKVPRFIAYQTEPFPRTPSMRVKKSALVADAGDLREGAWDREAQAPEER
jgi:carnitine-CoA ligase